jgi:protein-L-isoaspartate(D-aspartate) O-methyltransferase
VAFADTEIPLGQGVSMLPPKLEARALQALNLRKSDRVLEIGTGSGYMAALLAAHAAQVLTVEIIPELADKAAATLSRQGVGNVIVSTGDGSLGWPAQAPYDVIMISGALPVVPPQLLDQLKVGGRMLAFVGALPLIEAQRITRTGVAAFQVETLFETQVPALVCATRSGGFSF